MGETCGVNSLHASASLEPKSLCPNSSVDMLGMETATFQVFNGLPEWTGFRPKLFLAAYAQFAFHGSSTH